jgi:hypothetical protein
MHFSATAVDSNADGMNSKDASVTYETTHWSFLPKDARGYGESNAEASAAARCGNGQMRI